jgi:hypothetical protein
MGGRLIRAWGVLSAVAVGGLGGLGAGCLGELTVANPNENDGGTGGSGSGPGATSTSTSSGGVVDMPALWSKRFGDGTTQTVADIAVDAEGSIFVAGSFLGTLEFPPAASITSAGDYDGFVLKLNSQGDPVWAVAVGGAGTDKLTSIAVDPNNGVYVTGEFTGTFGVGEFTLTNTGGADAFLAGFSFETGKPISVRHLGGPGDQRGRALAFSGQVGVLYCAGEFSATMHTDIADMTSEGLEDVFLTGYSVDGSQTVAAHDGDPQSQTATALAAGSTGELFLAAQFDGELDAFDTTPQPSAGGGDVFLMKRTVLGDIAWSMRFGDAAMQRPSSLAAGPKGNVAMAGVFEGEFIVSSSFTLASQGNRDAFVVKITESGATEWAKSFGDGDPLVTVDDQEALDVATDGDGNVYVTGFAAGAVDFGDGKATAAGDADLFIVKLDSLGKTVWYVRSGGTDPQYGRAVAIDGGGNLIVAGDFRGMLNLGNGPLTSAGSNDVFVAKFAPVP